MVSRCAWYRPRADGAGTPARLNAASFRNSLRPLPTLQNIGPPGSLKSALEYPPPALLRTPIFSTASYLPSAHTFSLLVHTEQRLPTWLFLRKAALRRTRLCRVEVKML